MKRSELRKKIARYILDEINQEYMVEGNEDVISSEILELIEEAGMLPPDSLHPAVSISEYNVKEEINVKNRWKWEKE